MYLSICAFCYMCNLFGVTGIPYICCQLELWEVDVSSVYVHSVYM